jgi:putative ABC transport system permease protein
VLSGLRDDLRDAVRSLIKHPGFTMVAILTLAVGAGANTAIFSVLHAVVLRDLPYGEVDRLALLWTFNTAQQLRDGSSFLNARDWKEQSRAFEDIVVYRRPEHTRATIASTSEAAGDRERTSERIDITLVGPGFFQLLDAAPLLGRTLEDADFASGHRPVVISHELWRRRFGGDPHVIGRTVDIDRAACQIVGVMSAEFAFPRPTVHVWLPISVLSDYWDRMQTDPWARGGDPLMAIGRLRPSVSIDTARAEMDTIAARLRDAYPDANRGKGILVEPLMEHVIGSRTSRALWLLLGAVGFVLLIACANVANLALARGAARQDEFSIRIALGASRMRLVRQALTESLVLALMAASVGLLFAWLGVNTLRAWASGALPRLGTVRLDLPVLLFSIGTSIGCGMIAGLLPAVQLSAAHPATALRERGPGALGGRRGRRMRHALAIAEIALAVILLSGAGLLIRSFLRVQSADRGFNSRDVLLLQVELPGETYNPMARRLAYAREALDRLRAHPGVAAAGAVAGFFIARQPDMRIAREGQPPRALGAPAPPLTLNHVVPGFFEAMGIPVLRGRSLRDADLDLHALSRVVVVNETMARRFWPGEDAVGKRFKYGRGADPKEPWTTVVGVVADMRRQRLDESPIPYMFRPGVPRDITFTVRTVGDPAPLRQALRAELLAVEPAAPPFGIITVEERLDETVALRTLQTLLLGTLAAAALVLAVIGVYGIIHQSVVARTREIGVRMALGASRPSVLRMILARALALATTGLAIGLMGALALGQTIAAFLYETSPLDPLIYAAVAALPIAVTTVACIVPARRAARIDPMIALRAD